MLTETATKHIRLPAPAAEVLEIDNRPSDIVGRIRTYLTAGDHLVLMCLAGLGMLLLAPRHLALAHNAVAPLFGARPLDPAQWPYVPRILPLGVLAALLTFRVERGRRMVVLACLIVPVAWLRGALGPDSVLQLTAFALVMWGIIRLPLQRVHAGLLVTVLTIAAVYVGARHMERTGFIMALAGFPMVLPMLWYSVYEQGRAAGLSMRRYLLYMAGRLFGSPVLTYNDLFRAVPGTELRALRWRGVRTLYIALLASFAVHAANLLAARTAGTALTGLPLLGASYVQYVGAYCRLVVRFNTFLGILLLFGIPVRNVFRYWLLARTPNEHWQRWNILAREWLLTFVFYPIMRARRSVFAAIMATLGVAGLLHTVPLLVLNGFVAPLATASMLYWIINGLAIYAVIMIPRLYPGAVRRLHLGDSYAWSAAGIVLTSAFYAVLHGMRTSADSWSSIGEYLVRLTGV